MRNRKRIWLFAGIGALLVAVLLVPRRRVLEDGGTVEYRALLYTYTRYDTLCLANEPGSDGCVTKKKKGSALELLGITLYDKSTLEDLPGEEDASRNGAVTPTPLERVE